MSFDIVINFRHLMKGISKTCLAIFGMALVFISLYGIQNLECKTRVWYSDLNIQLQTPSPNIQLQNPKVDKRKLEDAMTCLESGFYFIQKFYTTFTEMWNHYLAVIEVSVNHYSLVVSK